MILKTFRALKVAIPVWVAFVVVFRRPRTKLQLVLALWRGRRTLVTMTKTFRR